MSARIFMAAVAVLGTLLPTAGGWPGQNAPEVRIARVAALLDDTEIDTTTLDANLTVGKLLTALGGRLPKGSGFGFETDRAAFGNDTAGLMALPVHLRTHGHRPLRSVLEDALGQVPAKVEVDYALRPTGVVLTRTRLAAVSETYDIGEALRIQRRFLSDQDGRTGPVTPARLAEFLATTADLRPWETIDVLNGRRLSVSAAPARQHAVATLVASTTRLADLGVYMNARLYEVDRAFYAKVVAPAFERKKGGPAPVAVRVEQALLDQLVKQTLIQEGEAIKLAPEQTAVFLVRERLVQGLGLTGLSVAVRPEVSPDRRHLRLHLTRTAAEVVRPDGPGGPDTPAEGPTVRKTTVAGTVEVADGEPFLMPVDVRPPGTDGKVWVLAARPLIWIEAEERERGGGSKPGDVWAGNVVDELRRELAKRPTPIPAGADATAILQAVLDHVLTDKELEGSRKFYGTEADRTVLLSNSGRWTWPDAFRPDLHGYKLVTSRPGRFARQAESKRVLGIRIDRFDPSAKVDGLFDAPVEVCVFNAGGTANGAVIGGCSAYYVPKKVDGKWVVKFAGLLDP